MSFRHVRQWHHLRCAPLDPRSAIDGRMVRDTKARDGRDPAGRADLLESHFRSTLFNRRLIRRQHQPTTMITLCSKARMCAVPVIQCSDAGSRSSTIVVTATVKPAISSTISGRPLTVGCVRPDVAGSPAPRRGADHSSRRSRSDVGSAGEVGRSGGILALVDVGVRDESDPKQEVALRTLAHCGASLVMPLGVAHSGAVAPTANLVSFAQNPPRDGANVLRHRRAFLRVRSKSAVILTGKSRLGSTN
jgi:hypothetical protein